MNVSDFCVDMELNVPCLYNIVIKDYSSLPLFEVHECIHLMHLRQSLKIRWMAYYCDGKNAYEILELSLCCQNLYNQEILYFLSSRD